MAEIIDAEAISETVVDSDFEDDDDVEETGLGRGFLAPAAPNSRMGRPSFQNPVIPDRLAYLRVKANLTQSKLVEYIREQLVADGARKIPKSNPSIISSWETGRRHFPDKYLKYLSELYSVTEGYLRGYTNDPDEEADEMSVKPLELSVIEIPMTNLYQYHKRPVYVIFRLYTGQNGWAILNYWDRQLVFYNSVYDFSTDDLVNERLMIYATAPLFENTVYIRHQFPLEFKQVLAADRVYICMKSPDPFIRGKYNGWYTHNEDHTALINSRGMVLPYDGIEVSFAAYQQAVDE